MIKLRMGILAGCAILALLAFGIVQIPTDVWFPTIQLAVFTTILIGLSPKINRYLPGNPLIQSIIQEPIYALIPAAVLVAFINFIQLITRTNRSSEKFIGSERAIGKTSIKPPNSLCPPTLDFTQDQTDEHQERQTPSCIADPTRKTEEEQLDEIDIYLRDVQESIARIGGYLNVARPDERWLSKTEMDNPENAKLRAKNFTLNGE